jgi:hypothetical protein
MAYIFCYNNSSNKYLKKKKNGVVSSISYNQPLPKQGAMGVAVALLT